MILTIRWEAGSGSKWHAPTRNAVASSTETSGLLADVLMSFVDSFISSLAQVWHQEMIFAELFERNLIYD